MTTTVESATATPVAIGAARGGPDQPTLRKDTWWVEPVVTVVVLTAFVVYSTWAAFVGKDYYAGADLHRDLISPFYSPVHRQQLRARAATPSARCRSGTTRRRC